MTPLSEAAPRGDVVIGNDLSRCVLFLLFFSARSLSQPRRVSARTRDGPKKTTRKKTTRPTHEKKRHADSAVRRPRSNEKREVRKCRQFNAAPVGRTQNGIGGCLWRWSHCTRHGPMIRGGLRRSTGTGPRTHTAAVARRGSDGRLSRLGRRRRPKARFSRQPSRCFSPFFFCFSKNTTAFFVWSPSPPPRKATDSEEKHGKQ